METWQVQRRYEWYEAKEEELQEGPPSALRAARVGDCPCKRPQDAAGSGHDIHLALM